MNRGRTGFTLLEVLLALLLTAVAVAIASLALRTAVTARDRVAEHRETLERESRLRAMLTDMLRHAPSAGSVDEPLLRVWRTPTGGAQLVFLSTGVRVPFGTGPTWRVTLTQIWRGTRARCHPDRGRRRRWRAAHRAAGHRDAVGAIAGAGRPNHERALA